MQQNNKNTYALVAALIVMLSLQGAAVIVWLLYGFTLGRSTATQNMISALCTIVFLAALVVALVMHRRLSAGTGKKGFRSRLWPLIVILLTALWPLYWYAAGAGVNYYHEQVGLRQVSEAKQRLEAANKAYNETKPPECLHNSDILYNTSMRLIDWTDVINKHGSSQDKDYMHEQVAVITRNKEACEAETMTPDQSETAIASQIQVIKQRAQTILKNVPASQLTQYEQKLLP